MNYVVLFIITGILASISLIVLVIVKPYVKDKCSNKYSLYICDFIIVVGLTLYVSFLYNLTTGTHIDSSYNYEKVPINRITTEDIWFGDDKCDLHESCVIIEKPNKKYDNVVIIETETYQIQWLCKYNVTGTTYHVYLTEDIYNKYQNSFFEIIYERME